MTIDANKNPGLADAFIEAAESMLRLARLLQAAGRKNEARARAVIAARMGIDAVRCGAGGKRVWDLTSTATRLQQECDG